MQPRCSGTTKAGAPCGAPAMSGGRYCVSHDPSRVTDLAAWRRKGGQGKSNKQRARRDLPTDPKDLADVKRVLGRALVGLEAGTLDPARGSAMAAVARAMVMLIEKDEFEQRLTQLEKSAGVARKGWTA